MTLETDSNAGLEAECFAVACVEMNKINAIQSTLFGWQGHGQRHRHPAHAEHCRQRRAPGSKRREPGLMVQWPEQRRSVLRHRLPGPVLVSAFDWLRLERLER